MADSFYERAKRHFQNNTVLLPPADLVPEIRSRSFRRDYLNISHNEATKLPQIDAFIRLRGLAYAALEINFLRYATNYMKMRDFLVEKNTSLAYSVAYKIASKNFPCDEDSLVSDALLSLIRAVDLFNPWKGYKFSTYAYTSIKNNLFAALSVEGRRRKKLSQITEDIPCNEDSSNEELPLDVLKHLLQDKSLLSQRERRILIYRFPNDGTRVKTLEELGREIGYCRETIRKLQEKAIKRLREAVLETDTPE